MGRVNKLKIALVTDSTSVLTKQEVSDNNITVVPIPVIIGDKEYLEGVNITSAQLFEAHSLLFEFVDKFEDLYCQRKGFCIYFVHQSIHANIHACLKTF